MLPRRRRARHLARGTPPGTDDEPTRRRPTSPTGAQVTLVPPGAAFVATPSTTRGRHPVPCEVYVDITTVPVWSTQPDGVTVTAVDLDLDVVRGWSGRVWVDDEDEFADPPGPAPATPPTWSGWPTSSCEAVRTALQDPAGRRTTGGEGLARSPPRLDGPSPLETPMTAEGSTAREAVVHGPRCRACCSAPPAAAEARALGVRGWVRNESDGTGRAPTSRARPRPCEVLVAWLRHGPRHAQVERVDVGRPGPGTGRLPQVR